MKEGKYKNRILQVLFLHYSTGARFRKLFYDRFIYKTLRLAYISILNNYLTL